MLQFEDSLPPAPALGLQPVFPTGGPTPARPATALASGRAPVTAPDDATSGRVRAEDKRVINGLADVNQLVPIKYKWAW